MKLIDADKFAKRLIEIGEECAYETEDCYLVCECDPFAILKELEKMPADIPEELNEVILALVETYKAGGKIEVKQREL